MTVRVKRILITVLMGLTLIFGSLSVATFLAKANLVSPMKEGSVSLLSVYEEGLGSGMELVFGNETATMNYQDSSDTSNSTKNIAINCTTKSLTELYIDFGKTFDIYTGNGLMSSAPDDFYKKGTIEFWIKLNDTPASFFNIYLFQSRGPEYSTADGNKRYIRSNVQLKAYVDTSIINEWQYVQVPFNAFSTNGEYVNDGGQKVKDTPVDLSKVCAMGFAHMMNNSATKINPTIQYDSIKIVYGNTDDENLGVTVVSESDFEKKKKNAKFTPIDITGLATSGYYGGPGVGWTNQGSQNELTGFDLVGRQEFYGVPFNLIRQEDNDNKSVIGLRSSRITSSAQFKESVTIPINLTIDGLYIIHNAAWATKKNVAKYTWVYDDGTSNAVDICIDKHIFEWWGYGESPVNAVIWKSSTAESLSFSMGISLNMFAFVNPEPAKKVKELKCEINSDEAACMIVGLTGADFGGEGMFMAEKENIYSPDTSDWYEYELADLEALIGSPLDVSYLLDTADHGKIVTRGDDFYFTDGTKANFWGVNVNAYSVFQTNDKTDMLINAIAAGGYNLIRLLDWDSAFYFPNIFGNNGNNKDVSDEQLEQLKYFWAKCKSKGIYIDFVMLGGRYASTEVVEGGLTADEVADIFQGFKMEIYIDERLRESTKELLRTVMGTTNSSTGTTLAQDRVLAIVEINNEANLLTMYDDSVNYQFRSNKYKTMAQEQYAEFLTKKYNPTGTLSVVQTENAIKEAWTEDGKIGFDASSESLSGKTIKIDGDFLTAKYSSRRCADGFEFFYSLMKDFYNDMSEWAKKPVSEGGLGIECPIAGGTNFANDDKGDLFLNAHYDYVARHTYQSHPTTGTEYQVGTSVPKGESTIGNLGDNTFTHASFKKVMGLPYIVTESLIAEPNIHSAEFNLIASAIYSYQGWNLVAFTYMNKAMDKRTNQITNSFIIMDHPGRFSTVTSASLLYQRAEITKANIGYYRIITIDDAMDYTNQNLGLPEGTYVVGKTGVYFADRDGNLLFQSGDFNIKDSQSDIEILEKILHSQLISEGGEMIWNQEEQTFIVNTKSTQGGVGYIGGHSLLLDDVDIKINTPYAQVTVSALGACVDGVAPTIADADKLLITAIGQSRNTGAELSTDGTTITELGRGPILVQPIIGKITFKTYDDLEIYILNTSGARVVDRTATVTKNSDGFTVLTLKNGDNTMYYEVVRKNVSSVKPVFTKYRDIGGECKNAIEAIINYMPGKTDTLFLTEETAERGDFIGALVNASGLTGGNRAYADANSSHWAYEQFKTAREHGLVDGLQIKAYDKLNYKTAFFGVYNVLKEKGVQMNGDVSILKGIDTKLWTDEEKTIIASLFSVKVVKAMELKSVKPTDEVSRGQTAQLLYRMTTAQNAEIVPGNNDKPNNQGGDSDVGIVLGILGGVCAVAGAITAIVIIRKKKKNADE